MINFACKRTNSGYNPCDVCTLCCGETSNSVEQIDGMIKAIIVMYVGSLMYV
jgi:hypothetical protein